MCLPAIVCVRELTLGGGQATCCGRAQKLRGLLPDLSSPNFFLSPPSSSFCVPSSLVDISNSGHEGCIKVLLLHGADPAAIDVHGPFCLTTGTLKLGASWGKLLTDYWRAATLPHACASVAAVCTEPQLFHFFQPHAFYGKLSKNV